MFYRFEDYSIDTGQYQLSRKGKTIAIEPLAFDLLVYLIQNPTRVVARDELLANLWPGKVVTDSALATRIKDARKALGDSGSRQQIIKTIHGRGYQFIAPIEVQKTSTQSNIFAQIGAGLALELPDRPSVAVLPLVKQGNGSNDEYFSDGLTDAIRHGLTRFRELFVMGRSSSHSFKNKSVNDTQIGRQLGVRHLVQGGLYRRGQHLQITLELVDAMTGQNLWSESYHGDKNELFALEDEVVRNIVSSLVTQVTEATTLELLRQPMQNLGAYDWVLRGNHLLERGAREDLLQAKGMYQRALEIDATVSAAYTGLSNVFLYLCWGQPGTEYRKLVSRSLEYGQKAVELDDRDSRAHYAVGHGYICLAQHEMAELHVEKALQLNPGEYHNLCFKGYLLACTGRHDESEACFSESIRRNPLAPNGCFCGVGLSSYLASKYEDASVMLARLSGYIYYPHKYTGLAATHAQLGDKTRAHEAATEYRAQMDPETVARLGQDSGKWRKHLTDLYSILEPNDMEHMLEGLRKAGLPV